jgi:4-amino-4-deoxy-L-arabinose transferase-like glycosyltransferase
VTSNVAVVASKSHPHTWRAWLPLGLIVLAYLAYAGLYLRIIPPLEGFDAIAHFNYVNYVREQRRLPPIDQPSAVFSYETVQQPPLYYALSALAASITPYEQHAEWARQSENPYQYSLSPRVSVTLPDAPPSFTRAAQIARLTSLLGGLLAVIGTWLLTRRLFPGDIALASLATCIVAFNPLFAYVSVAITNDAWSAGGVAVAAWLFVRAVQADGARYGRWFIFGCAFGLASLTKYSALLLGVPVAIASLAWLKGQPTRTWLGVIGVAAVGALLTSGFWHGRNLLLYGELAPLRAMAAAIPSLLREAPLSAGEIVRELPQLARTYWGVFVGAAYTNAYYFIVQAFAILGLAGVALWLIRQRVWRTREAFILLCCGAWVLATAIGLLIWLRQVTFAGQARLMLVAVPALAILIAFGWRRYWLAALTEAWRRGLALAACVALAALPLLPVPAFRHDFETPRPMDPNTPIGRVLKARYEDGMQIVGADFPHGATLPLSASLPVTLYLQADAVIPANRTLFVQLVGPQGEVLYQFDGLPYDGRHPTRQWRPGEMFADAFSITLKADAEVTPTPTVATLIAGFYPYDQPKQPLIAYDGEGKPIGERVPLSKVRVLDKPPDIQPLGAPLASWEGDLRLVEASLQPNQQDLTATLAWQMAALMQRDLTRFVHLLDAQGELIAQQDEQPQAGQTPTSVWLPGEVIRESITIPLTPAQAARWNRTEIGWYDPNTGQRLMLTGPNNDSDAFALQTPPR